MEEGVNVQETLVVGDVDSSLIRTWKVFKTSYLHWVVEEGSKLGPNIVYHMFCSTPAEKYNNVPY